MHRVIIVVACLAFSSAHARIPSPSAEQMRRFKSELAYLEKTFSDDQRKGDQFGDHFWRESKRVADHTGTEIIPAVVDYCKKWQDEKPLIFVPLVALLPRRTTLAILREMERSSTPIYRGFAHEFLSEFDMPDTKAAAEHYSRSKT